MRKVIKVSVVAAFFVLAIVLASGAVFIPGILEDITPVPEFNLNYEGSQDIVQYDDFGEFIGRGTDSYRYVIRDRAGLADAVGDGVHPSTSVYQDPEYKRLQNIGKLDGCHWDFLAKGDNKLSFYKWATASEDPGVRQFYTALALENSGNIKQAIKAYYAVIVHYPTTISFTYWKSPWYPVQVAIDRIHYLTRRYPLLGIKLVNAKVEVKNGYDLDPTNVVFSVDPGEMVKSNPSDVFKRQDIGRLEEIEKQIGEGYVKLIKYKSGDWQFKVDGKPFMVKAVAYAPTKIGQSADEGTIEDWSQVDINNNGKSAIFHAWVDENRNNIQDENEKNVGDITLLMEMGANTIRIYDHKQNSNKELFRKLHDEYGMMFIMGDVFGAYAIGSGTTWYRGTNYANPEHRKNIKARVLEMVEEHKDEPYVLMWLLGNENNYGVANSAKRFPEPFYEFANEVALEIKKVDPHRAVGICNGDTLYLDIFADLCPDIDVFGVNSYRGWQGFGFWYEINELAGKAVLVTEYGAPAYVEGKSLKEGEKAQSEYHRGTWTDIYHNSAGYGVGNAVGGVIFEWVDEWWKAYEPWIHDAHPQWPGPVKGGWMYEEWFGITGQGDGSDSPYMRVLRKAYFTYRSMWNPTVLDRIRKMWYSVFLKVADYFV